MEKRANPHSKFKIFDTLLSLLLCNMSFFITKCDILRGIDVRRKYMSYENKDRGNYWVGRHRTITHQRFPSMPEALFIKNLLNWIQSAPMPKTFEAFLIEVMIDETFYILGVLLAHYWKTARTYWLGLDWESLRVPILIWMYCLCTFNWDVCESFISVLIIMTNEIHLNK